jgi:hypothetical protein
MKHSRSYQQWLGASANRGDYDRVFVLRVHKLIKLGYDQLFPSDYATAEETAITGDMAEAIEHILEYPDEGWMRFYRVYDDPPVNELMTATRRRGNRRRRVDIKLDSSEVSPYTRFHFEAKRLGKGNPVSRYLGAGGLGCFLSGSYAGTERRGGMLGYVQSDDEQAWAAKIDKALTSKPESFGVQAGRRHFRSHQLIAELRHTYISEHRRSMEGQPILIYHSLLMFH